MRPRSCPRSCARAGEELDGAWKGDNGHGGDNGAWTGGGMEEEEQQQQQRCELHGCIGGNGKKGGWGLGCEGKV